MALRLPGDDIQAVRGDLSRARCALAASAER
jgi:hypothetical protein